MTGGVVVGVVVGGAGPMFAPTKLMPMAPTGPTAPPPTAPAADMRGDTAPSGEGALTPQLDSGDRGVEATPDKRGVAG